MPVDETNKSSCNRKKRTYCMLLASVLDKPKSQINTAISITSGVLVTFRAVKKEPLLIFNMCPFCGGKLTT